jgi:hypothetical protein
MKVRNENRTSGANFNNNFEAFSQEFDGGSFYGLEYILEDFFQITTVKPSVPTRPRPSVDWFGLYD